MQQFPHNLHHITLPYIVLDGLGITCNPNSNVGINLAANAGLLVGSGLLARAEFARFITENLPRILSANPEMNATMIYYILLNVLAYLPRMGERIDADSLKQTYEDEGIPGLISKCGSNPFTCLGAVISDLKKRKGQKHLKAKCRKNEDKVDGICYKKCPKGYEGVGNQCVQKCPKGFSDAGSICRKKTYNRGRGKPAKHHCPPGKEGYEGSCYVKCPKHSKRVGPCSCDFGKKKGVFHSITAGIEHVGLGQECTAENGMDFSHVSKKERIKRDKGKGWRKVDINTCQKGGVVSSCALWGHPDDAALSCDKKHPQLVGAMCYKAPKEGYTCHGSVCAINCPEGMEDRGLTCVKQRFNRGAGRMEGTCEPYLIPKGDKCYIPCPWGQHAESKGPGHCRVDEKDKLVDGTQQTHDELIRRQIYLEMRIRDPDISLKEKNALLSELMKVQQAAGTVGQSLTAGHAEDIAATHGSKTTIDEEAQRQEGIDELLEHPVIKVEEERMRAIQEAARLRAELANPATSEQRKGEIIRRLIELKA